MLYLNLPRPINFGDSGRRQHLYSPEGGAAGAMDCFTPHPYPIYPDYLWLQTQQPAQPGALPQRVPLPPLSDRPHLSYAIQ